MPTIDRKLRRRRTRGDERIDLADYRHTELLMHEAKASGDPEAWQAIRSRVIRSMMAHRRGMTAEAATKIFEVFARRPSLMPSLPPKDVSDDD